MSMFHFFFFFNQKTAYDMRISEWSSDVCSSDLARRNRCSSIRPRSRSSYILQHILREHLDAALVGVSRWRCLPGVEDPARLVRLHAEHPHQHRVAAAVDVEIVGGDRVDHAWPA